MATETSGDRAAQCSVPNITFSNEASTEYSRSGGPTTSNTPLVLLAKPRDPPGAVAGPGTTEMAPVSLLQRPLSAPTSMVSSSPSTSSLSNMGSLGQSESASLDVDASIVEALKSSKDRLYVLKLGETMESLIGQGKLHAKVELQPASSYQRLLVYRCAEFYHLMQESSPSTVAVAVIVTSDSRIPSKRIAELVPPEESVLPAFQIMRRVDRSKTASRATSVDGNLTDDGDDSTRSQGSGSKKKQHMTIEEREAAYHKARSRIFMDFEEKDASTSSGGAISSAASTVSYTGGSTGMSSVDGDGASTAPTESEYSGPVGRGKDSWFTGTFGGNNGRGMQNSGTTPTGTTLRSTAPPFTSPNVAPPPPMGTVHYLPPISDTNSLPDKTSSHPQQTPPSGAPAGGYPYPQPAIYPYYVPYFYPMPYPQPVAAHPTPSQPTNQTPDGQRPEHPANQQHPQPPAPAGYAPHLPPPIAGQPYPGYMWLPAHPGYMPVAPHAPTLPAQPTGTSIQPSQPAMNISRPASQASHQSHTSFDQRGQHSPPQQPPSVQQHPQGNPYTSYPPPPNAFQPSHLGASAQPAPSPLMHPNAPPQNSVDNRLPGPGPVVNPPFNPHSVGPNPPNGGGLWNNPYPPGNATGPNSAVMAQRPNAISRGSMPPPAAPGRPQSIVDMSRSILNSGASSAPGGPKRGMPRNPWGAYSYGPGVGVGGMHTANGPPGGPPLQAGPIGPAGGILRAPEGLNIRILPPITLENHSTGSSNGSSSSLRKRNANVPGATLKSPGDETSSVTSSSSSSSKRTFTSTASSQPQHHPLPERPDWVLESRPQQGGAIHVRNRGPGLTTSTRQLLQPSPAGMFNQSTTPSPVNGTSAIPSSTSSVSGSDTMSKEFPPLKPGAPISQGQTSRSRTPASPAGAWNNSLTSGTARPGSAGVVSPSPTRPGSINATATEPSDSRLDESDKKFERPPPKSGVALFNPRVSSSSRSKSRDNSLGAEGQSNITRSALSNSSMDSLSQKLEGAILTDKKAEDTTIRADEASSGSGTSYTGTTDTGSVDSAGRRTSVEC